MHNRFRAYQLALNFYRTTQTLALKGELKNQCERAALSVVLNLAEGAGKFHSPKEQKRFYRISLGSFREVQAILDIIEASQEIVDMAHRLGGHLYVLAK